MHHITPGSCKTLASFCKTKVTKSPSTMLNPKYVLIKKTPFIALNVNSTSRITCTVRKHSIDLLNTISLVAQRQCCVWPQRLCKISFMHISTNIRIYEDNNAVLFTNAKMDSIKYLPMYMHSTQICFVFVMTHESFHMQIFYSFFRDITKHFWK